MKSITLKVNGTPHKVDVGDSAILLDVLRDRVGVTSVREGCGVGACGACTVLAEGMTVSACLANAVRYDEVELVTADALTPDDAVVSAFVDSDAMQCGYCIPGFVLMTKELLSENPDPSDQDIIEHLAGNLCRCAAYREILEAVHLAAERSRA